MRAEVYTTLGYSVVCACLIAAVVMLWSGGKVFDVGSTVSQNKVAISEVKQEVDILKEKLNKSMEQDKETLAKVSKGHDEREAYQIKYLAQIDVLNKEVDGLKQDLSVMAMEHKKRLKLADQLAVENKRLNAEIRECERRRQIK